MLIPDAQVAEGVSIAPGAVVHAGARIGAGSRLGAGAVVHEGTQVGERCVIEDGAVLGKRPRLRAGSSAAGAEIGALVLEDEVTVCCGAVVYAGAWLASGAIIGDQSQVRERAGRPPVGARSRVLGRLRCRGRGARPDPDRRVRHRRRGRRGRRVPRPGRRDHQRQRDGAPRVRRAAPRPDFRRACRVGGGAVLVPGW